MHSVDPPATRGNTTIAAEWPVFKRAALVQALRRLGLVARRLDASVTGQCSGTPGFKIPHARCSLASDRRTVQGSLTGERTCPSVLEIYRVNATPLSI